MKRTVSLVLLPLVVAGLLAGSRVAQAATDSPVEPAVENCSFTGLWMSDIYGETRLEQSDPATVTGTYYEGDGKIKGTVEKGSAGGLVLRGTWIQGEKSSGGREGGKEGELRFYLNGDKDCSEIDGHWRQKKRGDRGVEWTNWSMDWDMRRI